MSESTTPTHRERVKARAAELVKQLDTVTDNGERYRLIDEALWSTSIESWRNALTKNRKPVSKFKRV